MHPVIIIPQGVHILEISHFPEAGKFQEIFKEITLHATVESRITLDHPGGLQTAQDTLVSTFFMTDVRRAFAAVRILRELGNFQ